MTSPLDALKYLKIEEKEVQVFDAWGKPARCFGGELDKKTIYIVRKAPEKQAPIKSETKKLFSERELRLQIAIKINRFRIPASDEEFCRKYGIESREHLDYIKLLASKNGGNLETVAEELELIPSDLLPNERKPS
jgi:hypothetical protein